MRAHIFFTFCSVTFAIYGYSQTGFTYQGQLLSGNAPVSSSVPVIFKLFDAPTNGTQVGSTVTQTIMPSNGLFTTNLDFGANVFNSTPRYLEITVNGTVLTPRQQITAAPFAYSLILPFIGTAASGDALHVITNDAANGVYGESTDPSGTGLYGVHSASTGISPGIYGATASTDASANAIFGEITSTTPGLKSAALRGVNNGTLDLGIGVYGSQNGSGYGVYGYTPSGKGVAGYSDSGNAIFGQSNTGAAFYAISTSGHGLYAHSDTNTGIYVASDTGFGLYSSSPENTAVYGVSTTSSGVTGTTSNGIGVIGEHTASNGTAAGVQGSTNSVAGNAIGVYGVVNSTSPGGNSCGVRGENKGTGNSGMGVWGAQNGSGFGVYGVSTSGIGVYGYSPNGSGVHGQSNSTSNFGIEAAGTQNAIRTEVL